MFSVTYFVTTTFFLSGSDNYFFIVHETNKKIGNGGEDVDRYGGGGVDGDDGDDYDDNDDIKLNKKFYNFTTRKLPDYNCL